MESDGVEESFEGMLRVAITAGGRLGEQLARARESMQRDAEARSRQEARELQVRFDAERAAAVAQIKQVHRSGWWDTANPQAIGSTYALAEAWREAEPQAQQAVDRIHTELRDRYNIDPTNTGADPQRVYEQVQKFEAARVAELAAAEQRKEAEERAEAAKLIAESDQLDRRADAASLAAEFEPSEAERERASHEATELRAEAGIVRSDAGSAYDSADRREATAAALTSKGIDRELVDARMRADISQGKPATQATATKTAPKARKGRSQGQPGRQAHIER